METRRSRSGSHDDALATAQLKLQGQSMLDLEQDIAHGWDTPESLLARWIRLHRLGYEVTVDRLTIRRRVQGSPKVERAEVEDPPGLFEG